VGPVAPPAVGPVAPPPVAVGPFVVAADPPSVSPGLPVAAPMPYPMTATPYGYAASPHPPHPMTLAPYPYGVVAPLPPRKGWLIALSITAGVLLLAAGALGVLWYLDHDQATRTTADQQAQIEELRSQVAQLEDDLDDTETQLQRAEDDLATAQACSDAVQAYVDAVVEAAAAGLEELPPQAQSVVREMFIACDVAP
jgi:outer membrane murein-binding lipoprotein Lpp